MYFAKDKKVSDLYRRELSLIHDVDKGTLFKVDVPDTKEMIDEQQSLNILSKETKQNLNAAINALPEQEKEVFINEYTNSPLFNHYAKKEIDELGSKFEQLDNEYRLLKDEYLDKFLKEDLNKITQRNLNRLSEKYNIDLTKSYAYGDTNGDFSMLSLVGNPRAINPSKELITRIKNDENLKSKTQIIIERKNVIYKLNSNVELIEF